MAIAHTAHIVPPKPHVYQLPISNTQYLPKTKYHHLPTHRPPIPKTYHLPYQHIPPTHIPHPYFLSIPHTTTYTHPTIHTYYHFYPKHTIYPNTTHSTYPHPTPATSPYPNTLHLSLPSIFMPHSLPANNLHTIYPYLSYALPTHTLCITYPCSVPTLPTHGVLLHPCYLSIPQTHIHSQDNSVSTALMNPPTTFPSFLMVASHTTGHLCCPDILKISSPSKFVELLCWFLFSAICFRLPQIPRQLHC